jgi:hypothetical protein
MKLKMNKMRLNMFRPIEVALIFLLSAAAVSRAEDVKFVPHGGIGATEVNLFIENNSAHEVFFSLSEDRNRWLPFHLGPKKSGDASPSISQITKLYIKIKNGKPPEVKLTVGKRYQINQIGDILNIVELTPKK